MLEKTLEKLGLSEKEARVYLALLGIGQATVQQIAKKAGVVRPTTYVILETLSKKGLATTVEKNGKVYFAAESPEQLQQFLKQQEQEISTKVEELKRAMPELVSIFALSGDRPTMRFYEGKDGVAASDDDAYRSLKPSEQIYAFSPADEMERVYPGAFTVGSERRLAYDIWTNVIYSSKAKLPYMNSEKLKRRARYIPI
ncbi:MAG: helix-turn-helix domain-containing protein, partial [Patescibacteria group bacterium]